MRTAENRARLALHPWRRRKVLCDPGLLSRGGTCLFDVMSESDRRSIGCERSLCSFLQKLPGIGRNHRIYLPLMPLAIEQFD